MEVKKEGYISQKIHREERTDVQTDGKREVFNEGKNKISFIGLLAHSTTPKDKLTIKYQLLITNKVNKRRFSKIVDP